MSFFDAAAGCLAFPAAVPARQARSYLLPQLPPPVVNDGGGGGVVSGVAICCSAIINDRTGAKLCRRQSARARCLSKLLFRLPATADRVHVGGRREKHGNVTAASLMGPSITQ